MCVPALQVGAASSDDVAKLHGELEAARAEHESAVMHWDAERGQLVAAADGLYRELQRAHTVLQEAVDKVGAIWCSDLVWDAIYITLCVITPRLLHQDCSHLP